MLLPAEAAHWHVKEGGKGEKGGGEGEREQKGREKGGREETA